MESMSATQDVSLLRRIKVINRKGITPAAVGNKPNIRWIKIHKLRVNDTYQRSLSERGIKLIKRIISNFNWAKFHVPVVVQITPDTGLDDDTYEILDGQHTATAAASHGGIFEIPCMIVEAGTLMEKADAFVGLNKNQIRMTSIQTFWAEVTSGKEDAVEALRGAQLAGAKIVKRPPPYGDFEVGEVASPAALMRLAHIGGAAYVKRVLEVGVAAGLAPIGIHFINAFELLLLKSGNLKLEGPYEEIKWKVAQAVRRLDVGDLMDSAQKMKRSDGETLAYNLALILKREVDDYDRKQRSPS